MSGSLTPPEPTNWFLALIQGTTSVPKAVAKLINTVGEQIGFLLEPTHIRRRAAAKADAAMIEAEAESEISLLQFDNRLALQDKKDRAKERVRKKEARRQANIEEITAQAAQQLPGSVSETPVDEDWVVQFFEHAQDVSNDKMQSLWARLLAGEVAQPGSFSLRTLSVIKMLRPADAHLFTTFCRFVWKDPNGLIPLLSGPSAKIAEDQGLTMVALLLLGQIGLIEYDKLTGFSLKGDANSAKSGLVVPLHYYGRPHVLRLPTGQAEFEIGGALLSDVGRELAPIAGSTPDESYLKAIVEYWRSKGIEVEERPRS
jgi:hypothetical protein